MANTTTTPVPSDDGEMQLGLIILCVIVGVLLVIVSGFFGCNLLHKYHLSKERSQHPQQEVDVFDDPNAVPLPERDPDKPRMFPVCTSDFEDHQIEPARSVGGGRVSAILGVFERVLRHGKSKPLSNDTSPQSSLTLSGGAKGASDKRSKASNMVPSQACNVQSGLPGVVDHPYREACLEVKQGAVGPKSNGKQIEQNQHLQRLEEEQKFTQSPEEKCGWLHTLLLSAELDDFFYKAAAWAQDTGCIESDIQEEEVLQSLIDYLQLKLFPQKRLRKVVAALGQPRWVKTSSSLKALQMEGPPSNQMPEKVQPPSKLTSSEAQPPEGQPPWLTPAGSNANASAALTLPSTRAVSNCDVALPLTDKELEGWGAEEYC